MIPIWCIYLPRNLQLKQIYRIELMRSMYKDRLQRSRYALHAIATYFSLLLLPGGSLLLIALIASRHRPSTKVHA
jgi:hypothetical protein